MPFLEHVWQLFAFVLILVAPIPASLTATSRARCNGPHVLAHTTLVLLTWWCALQCAIGIVLGSMDLLRLPFLLTAEIALLSTGLLLLRRGRDSIGGLRAAVETRVAGVADRRIFLLLGVLIAMGTTLVCRAVTFPVTNFDSLAYHLPHVAEWYQSGSLVALSSMRQIARYPFNWEVLQALFVLPFGEDFLVALPNALACLVLGVAVYRLSVQLGATPVVALTAAGLCMTVPDVTQQLRTGLVDVAFAAFFVASLCFVVESHRSGRVGSLAPFLLSVGLLLGIKASALPYASILLLLWIAPRQWWSPSFGAWRDRTSTPRLMTVGSLALFLLLGGFWYARNWMEIGNPLGYVPVRIAGFELLAGDEQYAQLWRTTLANLFDLRSAADWNVLWNAVQAKWQIPFGVFAIQLMLLPFALRFRSEVVSKRVLLLILTLAAICTLLYWNTPFSGDNGSHDWKITGWIATGLRYGLPLLAVMAVTGALITTALRFPAEPLVALVVACCGLAVSIAIGVEILEFLLLLFVILWGLWRLRRSQSHSRKLRWSAVTLLAVVALTSLSFVARSARDANRVAAYGHIQAIVEREVPAGEKVGYLMSHKPYVLYGRKLDRRVYHAPARERSRAEWVQHLREQGITLLAVGPIRRDFSDRKELVWLRDESGAFVRVFGPDQVLGMVLFRLRE